MEDTAEVEAAGFPVFDALAGVEQVGTADQVIKLADAELRHQLADFLGDKKEVIDDVFRLAGEFLAQHRILGGNTHRTGVEVAFAHHDAALDHQRRGGKAELVGAEQRADDDIAAGFELAVDLHRNAAAQAVQHQRLLGFGQAEFPRRAGVFDGRPRAGASAAVVAGNGHVIGFGFGHACGHRADADFRHQLDADRGRSVAVLQVVDQLRQIFDRIDVMVRRR